MRKPSLVRNARSLLLLAALPLLAPFVPAGANEKVDFAREIHPLLAEKCFSCHNSRMKQGGLALDRLEGVIEGGASGPAVIPGNSADSLLIARVKGEKPPRMPMGGDPLPPGAIALLAAWIDQGARWAGVEAKVTQAAPLAPRRPDVPTSTLPGSDHPIDRFVGRYLERNAISAPEPVDDALFARRAYLDLWGVLPPPEDLRAFVTGRSPEKRAALIDRLLAEKRNYAEHWISFWNDLLRNDEGVIYHGGRESITPWLFAALEQNMPYGKMVRALLNPQGEGGPEGFLIGVNWRGTVSASQTPPMQAAQNSAQVFLGINIKCASCHDSFINQWKLRDSYGLAAFFSEGPLEMVRCDAPTGRIAGARFLYPEMGGVDANASLEERRAAAARLFTAQENGRFARTMVNRYWHRLFGQGLVLTLDDMDQPPWDADLLDWLAADFAAHGHDLKHLLRRIMTSRAYQLPSVSPPAEKEFVFRGPLVRRLSAEQFVDSISAITGEWRTYEEGVAGRPSREWRLKSTPLTRALGRPVRDQVYTERNEQASTLQALEMLNGETFQTLLERGSQRLLGRLQPAPENLWDSGVVTRKPVAIDANIQGAEKLWLLVRDWGSYDAGRIRAGWVDVWLEGPSGRVRLSELDAPDGAAFEPLERGEKSPPRALVSGAPATYVFALGGRNYQTVSGWVGVDEASRASDINPRLRFFLFAEPPDEGRLVRVRGEAPLGSRDPAPREPAALVRWLYEYAFGRPPAAAELEEAEKLLSGSGRAISTAGLEDLLWSLFLSPEFQMIR